jgi:putative ABC transport system permease protein
MTAHLQDNLSAEAETNTATVCFGSEKRHQNFAYQTTIEWWVFAIAGLFTLFGVLLPVCLQTYSAARRIPVKSLRDE